MSHLHLLPTRTLTTIGYSSIMLLVVLLLLCLCPISPSPAGAVTEDSIATMADDAGNSSRAIQSTIALSVDSRLTMDILPTQSGEFVSSGMNFSVATTNAEGYAIYLGTTSGEPTLALLGQKYDAAITPITGAISSAAFPRNTWGYRLLQDKVTPSTSDLLYRAVPGELTKVREITLGQGVLAANNSFSLEIGARVDTTIPAGAYGNTIGISIVTNPRKQPETLLDLFYMQEMTSPICSKSAIGDTKQLLDQRDSKSYWVAKLADGNCWMTQNLALDLSSSKPLTPELSDVQTNWTPVTTSTNIPNVSNDPSPTGTSSWNMGNYVLATPTKISSCNNLTAGQSPSSCQDLYEVSELNPSNIPNSLIQDVWEDYNGLVAVDLEKGTYDAHYLLGYYYQWNTATAGTGGTMVGGVAKGSICPKGWTLPETGTYATLASQYGITDAPTGSTINDTVYNIVLSPLNFVRAGEVNPKTGSFGYFGKTGYAWTSVPSPYDAKYAYLLYFDATMFSPTGYPARYTAVAVRCIAS